MSKIVLGGGIGGLSAAYYLRKKLPHEQIILIEGSSRTGGWIKSSRQVEGYIFEQGPRTLRLQGPKGENTLKLIDELNLGSLIKPIPSNHPAAINRMIYANGKLYSMPSSFWSIFKKTPPFSKPIVRYLLNDLTAPAKVIPERDESIYSFAERRFGKEIADYAISPLICGICAGDAKRVSVKFLMENLFDSEQRYGNISKGILYEVLFARNRKPKVIETDLFKRAKKEKWSVYSLSDGLETLPMRLEQALRKNNVDIKLNLSCAAVEFYKSKVQIYTSSGDKILTNHLISSLPAHVLGNLLVGHTKLKQLLQSITCVNVCVINLHFKKKVLNTEGFGFLVPPKENIPILGVTFDSCCFPHGEGTVLTVMMGGYWFDKYFGNNPTESDLLQTALNQIQTILGISEKPDTHKINILPNCIPQYVVGHNNKVDLINKYITANHLPLSLCGSSYYGVGINDVIMSAKNVIDNL
ncbi:hypothetical protein ILUMI_23936 [Ignelater luminosus]|uniref:Protoporphyrinogen oxidase n=1 Tax=Ignelater luminosus TaxID=2038154 RepID=A0A8K0CCZ1_IGNLU|nr:hypothetical protein ILUMI_23936 [Ignelater luminosus]